MAKDLNLEDRKTFIPLRMTIDAYLDRGEKLSVMFDIAETFNGKQSYIIYQGEDRFKMSAIEGQEERSFAAQVVNQVVPESSDDRMLAYALHSVVVSISESGGAE